MSENLMFCWPNILNFETFLNVWDILLGFPFSL